MKPVTIRLLSPVLLAGILAVSATGQDTKEFKFTNNNSANANDLHVEFDRQVTGCTQQTPANTFAETSGSGTNTMNFAQGQTGGGVAGYGAGAPPGASVVLKIQYTGSVPKVKRARWTDANTLTPNMQNGNWAGWLGDWMKFDEKKIEWIGNVPATGNGLIDLVIDGQHRQFLTHPGETGVAVAARFKNFVEMLPYGAAELAGPASATFYGRSLDNLGSNTVAQVLQQDATLPCSISDVPVEWGTTYCTAKTNSLGCVPSIWSTGTPSATLLEPFTIGASNELSQVSGLLFYGYASHEAPFQGGWMCVAAPVRRTPIQNSGGAPQGGDCSGQYAYDFNARIRSGIDPQLVLGTAVYAQYWSRDPASGSTTNLSDAVEFLIQ